MNRQHVVLAIPTAFAASRAFLLGVLRYAQQYGQWDVNLHIGVPGELGLEESLYGHCDGAMIYPQFLPDVKRPPDVPYILFWPDESNSWGGVPVVRSNRALSDDSLMGTVAAEFLLQSGFKSFACVGDSRDYKWSVLREKKFVDKLAEKGFECHVLVGTSTEQLTDAAQDEDRMIAWLSSLKKPVAIYAVHDVRGRQVLDCCDRLGLRTPGDVAVLGQGDDELICTTSYPQLSSIALDMEKSGFEAARTLDRLMRGETVNGGRPVHIVCKNAHVVSRQSTDIMQVDNPLVVRALKMLRSEMPHMMNVKTLSEKLHVSSRLLEMRFKEVLGVTVRKEIISLRIEFIQRLLRDTDLQIQEIATMVGFRDIADLWRVFNREAGISPKAYRERFCVKR